MLDGMFGPEDPEAPSATCWRAPNTVRGMRSRSAQLVATVRHRQRRNLGACVREKHWQWTFLAASAVYHTIAPDARQGRAAAFPGNPSQRCGCRIGLLAQGEHAQAHQYCSRT